MSRFDEVEARDLASFMAAIQESEGKGQSQDNKEAKTMLNKVFVVETVKDRAGVRLNKDYLKPDEITTIIGIFKLLGGEYKPRLNLWLLHPENISLLESLFKRLNSQVAVRIAEGKSAYSERRNKLIARESKKVAAKEFKNLVFRTLGAYCEGCGGTATVHHRIVPKSIESTDKIENFRVMCRGCQKKVRHYFNQKVVAELLTRDGQWCMDTYAEAITRIVDGDDEDDSKDDVESED